MSQRSKHFHTTGAPRPVTAIAQLRIRHTTIITLALDLLITNGGAG